MKQNRLSNLRVILVDDYLGRASDTAASLEAVGCTVLAVIPTGAGLLKQIADHEPDIIIIALDSPDRDVLESLSVASIHNPRPVAMFSGTNDTSFIGEAIRSGVTAYQAQDIHPARVEAAIDVAIAQFQTYSVLRTELSEVRTKLDERKVIERAKGLLMSKKKISEERAFVALRKTAMNRNSTLAEAAQDIIDLFESQSKDS